MKQPQQAEHSLQRLVQACNTVITDGLPKSCKAARGCAVVGTQDPGPFVGLHLHGPICGLRRAGWRGQSIDWEA